MNRRQFLRDTVFRAAGIGAWVLATGPWLARSAQAACRALGRTPAQTEGPYYKRNPPPRAGLVEPGMGGASLRVTGRVLDAECHPLAQARVDVWQADASGAYDNDGYRLRGYQRTDAEGRFRVDTVVPGLYPGRTRHIHVKITPVGGRTLTTQLYFPDEPENARDGIFDPALVLKLSQTAEGKQGEFDFVLVG